MCYTLCAVVLTTCLFQYSSAYPTLRRIIGGEMVEIWNHPYHVGYGLHCSGAIIHDKWVLTAAHCGYESRVHYASKYLRGGRWSIVKRHLIHPGWRNPKKSHTYDYDFQLLEQESRLIFDKYAQPIRLGRPEDLREGTLVTITGWGLTSVEDGTSSTELQATNVLVVNIAVCQKVKFPHYRGTITNRMFCAGSNIHKRDACQGDSGGPAVANNRLVGVISFGYGCATPGAYGVYAKVDSVKDWIKGTTGLYFD